jgi:hypothetical protein
VKEQIKQPTAGIAEAGKVIMLSAVVASFAGLGYESRGHKEVSSLMSCSRVILAQLEHRLFSELCPKAKLGVE